MSDTVRDVRSSVRTISSLAARRTVRHACHDRVGMVGALGVAVLMAGAVGLAACGTARGGTTMPPATTTPVGCDAACRFPTFERATEPLTTIDGGKCNAALAGEHGGDCSNFHWLGLLGDPSVVFDGTSWLRRRRSSPTTQVFAARRGPAVSLRSATRGLRSRRRGGVPSTWH